MIRDSMVAALLKQRLSGTGVVTQEAASFLTALCRDGMTDTEIGITFDRLSPMMRGELIEEIRTVALTAGIVLPPGAATTFQPV